MLTSTLAVRTHISILIKDFRVCILKGKYLKINIDLISPFLTLFLNRFSYKKHSSCEIHPRRLAIAYLPCLLYITYINPITVYQVNHNFPEYLHFL